MSKASIARQCIPYDTPPPISLSEWQKLPKRGESLLPSLPPISRFRAGDWCRGHTDEREPTPHCHYPQSIEFEIGRLYFVERIGPYTIIAFYFFPKGYFVAQVFTKSKRIIKLVRVCPPRDVWWEDSMERRRQWALRTAEAVVLELKECQVRGRKSPEAEAWLRRQLDGLGKSPAENTGEERKE